MPSTIRFAALADLAKIKQLADEHRYELGFVRSATLKHAIQTGEVVVACNDLDSIVGFAHFHHRLDRQTKLHNIVVHRASRQRGIGRKMFRYLCRDAVRKEQLRIVLKCPSDLPANRFYHRLRLRCIRTETGKKRALRVWCRRL